MSSFSRHSALPCSIPLTPNTTTFFAWCHSIRVGVVCRTKEMANNSKIGWHGKMRVKICCWRRKVEKREDIRVWNWPVDRNRLAGCCGTGNSAMPCAVRRQPNCCQHSQCPLQDRWREASSEDQLIKHLQYIQTRGKMSINYEMNES